MKVTVARKAHFNAAHRLYRADWPHEKNESVFGKCNNPHFHGHNYDLVVRVTGSIDPETGYVVDMKWLKDLIEAEVVEYLDHKNLNLDVKEFATLNPTAENIAVVIWQRLRHHILPAHDLHVQLFETERNFVEFAG